MRLVGWEASPSGPRAPGGVEASLIRVLRLARPAPVSNCQEKTGSPAVTDARFFAGPRPGTAATGRARAGPARHGIQASAPERPEDHGRQRS